MRLERVIAACLCLGLVGCGEGDVYDRPPDQVRDLLKTVEIPLYMLGSSTDTDAVLDSSDPARLVWKIKSDDSTVMMLSATIVPEGQAKSRVLVALNGARTGRFGDVEARMAKAPGVKQFYLVTMREAVDSTLDGRAFDITATYGAMVGAAAANSDRLFGPPAPKPHPPH